jgi:hypothetical protein
MNSTQPDNEDNLVGQVGEEVGEEYVAPAIIPQGDLNEVTQGGTSGNYLDASFGAGTPRGGLTFS